MEKSSIEPTESITTTELDIIESTNLIESETLVPITKKQSQQPKHYF